MNLYYLSVKAQKIRSRLAELRASETHPAAVALLDIAERELLLAQHALDANRIQLPRSKTEIKPRDPARRRLYYLKNRGRIATQHREYYLGNKAKIGERKAAWRARNPGRNTAYSGNERASRWRREGHITAEQWLNRVNEFDGRCAYCFAKSDAITMDHVVPLSSGGSHTLGNVVPACLTCNCKKYTKTLADWLAEPSRSEARARKKSLAVEKSVLE